MSWSLWVVSEMTSVVLENFHQSVARTPRCVFEPDNNGRRDASCTSLARVFGTPCHGRARVGATFFCGALARLFGFADSLSVERTYVTRTLPAGLARSLSDSLRLRRENANSRGAAIVAGLGSAA